jgi:hypothetical protein
VAITAKLHGPLKRENQDPLYQEERAWMQAPHSADAEGHGEVFLLDILSHRMSVMGILRQQCGPVSLIALSPD